MEKQEKIENRKQKIQAEREHRPKWARFLYTAFRNTIFMVKSGVFVALVLAIVITINSYLTPKYYYESGWPTTLTYSEFYELKDNSVDVLFLGSSHMACAFSPQAIYDEYGIHSYNLASGQQSVVTSYWWLREALQYQSPKVVVMDTAMLFDMKSYNALNASEGVTRQVFDQMKWSEVKWEAVNDICSLDTTQDVWSYVFPNIRYHARWQDMTADDFSEEDYTSEYDLMGFIPKSDNLEGTGADHYVTDASVDHSECGEQDMMPLMEQYMDKIVNLCKAQGIKLVLVNTPFSLYTDRMHNALQEYADEKKLDLYDFNVSTYYDMSGIIYSTDMQDQSHLNAYGAEKISKCVMQLIMDNNKDIKFENKKGDKMWKASSKFLAKVEKNFELKNIGVMKDYLKAINKDRYVIFVATQGTNTLYKRNETFMKTMKKMGFDLSIVDRGEAYVAVREDKQVTAQAADYGTVTLTGLLNNGKTSYSITGNALKANKALTEQHCSIMVGDMETEQSKVMDGINIVVYDKVTHMVVDKVIYVSYYGDYVIH